MQHIFVDFFTDTQSLYTAFDDALMKTGFHGMSLRDIALKACL